jgi:hypothetical protein
MTSVLLTILLVGVVLVGVGCYFLPLWVALHTHHRQAGAIAVINLCLGWTIVGWVVALVWAVYQPATPPPRSPV